MSTILVVDDEAAMRELYTRALAGTYQTSTARTAEEALDRLVQSSDIHVVVADLEMPGRGGSWLVERMRERFPSVAVILATANQSVPGTLSLQAAVVCYLVKPISGDQLRAAVSDALAWHERQASPSAAATGAGDPIETWLDRKLTRPHGDDDTPKR